jgi:thymidylate kinase
MDGAQVERVTGTIKTNELIKLLAASEREYYRQIMSPDLLVVLRVDPEICVQRKTDETPESVRSRSEEIWKLDWRGTSAHVIDASRSKSQVLADVWSLVWSHL